MGAIVRLARPHESLYIYLFFSLKRIVLLSLNKKLSMLKGLMRKASYTAVH